MVQSYFDDRMPIIVLLITFHRQSNNGPTLSEPEGGTTERQPGLPLQPPLFNLQRLPEIDPLCPATPPTTAESIDVAATAGPAI